MEKVGRPRPETSQVNQKRREERKRQNHQTSPDFQRKEREMQKQNIRHLGTVQRQNREGLNSITYLQLIRSLLLWELNHPFSRLQKPCFLSSNGQIRPVSTIQCAPWYLQAVRYGFQCWNPVLHFPSCCVCRSPVGLPILSAG